MVKERTVFRREEGNESIDSEIHTRFSNRSLNLELLHPHILSLRVIPSLLMKTLLNITFETN